MTRVTTLGVLALLIATACRTDSAADEPVRTRSTVATAPAHEAAVEPTAGAVVAVIQEPAAQASRAERMAAIEKEYDDAIAAWRAALKEAAKDSKTPEERRAVSEKLPRPDPAPWRARARALVDEDAEDEVTLDAITWMLTGGRMGSDQDELLAIVEAHHLRSAKLGELCEMMANTRTGRAPAFMERVIAENPHREVVGKACFEVAQAVLREVDTARRAQARTDQADIDEWKKRVGAERASALLALDPAAQTKHAEKLLERVVKEFADLPYYDDKLGEEATHALFALHNLAVGMVAPDIEGEDLAGVPFKLSDYRGKVVMLDYWGNW